MKTTTLRSIWAVVAGILAVIVVTTLVDIALHATGVYPAHGEPLTDALAGLALGYRVIIGIAAAVLTAWLAPDRPMRHALILGAIGTVFALIGVAATWNAGLSPRWYPIAIAVLAIPQSWAGGRLWLMRAARTT